MHGPVLVERHPVGDVDQRRDRLLAHGFELALEPVGGLAVPDVADNAVGEDRAVVGLDRHADRAGAAAALEARAIGAQAADLGGRKVPRHAAHAEAVGAVGGDVDLDHRVVDLAVVDVARADRRVLGQLDDAVVVVRDQQFSLRAQHAFGAFAPDRTEFEGKVLARDIRAHGGKHGDETGARVGGAADDVVDRAVAGIDLTDPQLVGVGVLLGGDDPGHDEGGQRAFFDLFEFKADGGQLVGDGAQVSVGIEVLFEPIKGEFHGLAPPD